MAASQPRWQPWKFGLKQESLAQLHQEFNTFPNAIQDSSSFHHDVEELAAAASDLQQLRSMLSERRELRLSELNQAFEYTAKHLIGDPELLDDTEDQWEHALRIFRSRSYDALVQYFASYLPSESGVKRQSSASCPRSKDVPSRAEPPRRRKSQLDRLVDAPRVRKRRSSRIAKQQDKSSHRVEKKRNHKPFTRRPR